MPIGVVTMGVLLSKLIEDIGVAVQKANRAIEENAAAIYLRQAYKPKGGDTVDEMEHAYVPVSYTLYIPGEGSFQKPINVPLTVLMHNTTLQLESVNVHLRFCIDEDNGEVVVSVKPHERADNSPQTSELSLQFKVSPPPEGEARVVNRYTAAL